MHLMESALRDLKLTTEALKTTQLSAHILLIFSIVSLSQIGMYSTEELPIIFVHHREIQGICSIR